MTGLEELRESMAGGTRPGIAETIGFRLAEVSEGAVVLLSIPGPHLFNPLGGIHGGFAATLLDSACGLALHASLPGDQGYATLEIKVSYLKAITAETGEVRAQGRVVSVGRRTAFTEATLTDASGRLLATATSTLLIVDRSAKG